MSEAPAPVADGPSDILSAYLAGPGVFQPEPLAHGEMQKAVCRKHLVRGVHQLLREPVSYVGVRGA